MEERNQDLDGALFVDDDEDTDYDGQPGDGKAEDAAEVVEALLSRMDLDCDVEIRRDGERIVIDVGGPDSGRAIGRKGQTLDALQFLVNKIVNRHPEGRRHVILDSGDYRERHDNSLVSRARREATKVADQGKVVTLEPMSPRDRRVIHLSLAKFPGVSTRSEGQGPDRRLQILPANARSRRR
jgi:spoIIIJ-associated protein